MDHTLPWSTSPGNDKAAVLEKAVTEGAKTEEKREDRCSTASTRWGLSSRVGGFSPPNGSQPIGQAFPISQLAKFMLELYAVLVANHAVQPAYSMVLRFLPSTIHQPHATSFQSLRPWSSHHCHGTRHGGPHRHSSVCSSLVTAIGSSLMVVGQH